MKLGKAFRAVSALKQKSLALDDLRQVAGQVASFAGEHQRRIIAQRFFGRGQRGCIPIHRHMNGLCFSPAIWRPSRRHFNYSR